MKLSNILVIVLTDYVSVSVICHSIGVTESQMAIEPVIKFRAMTIVCLTKVKRVNGFKCINIRQWMIYLSVNVYQFTHRSQYLQMSAVLYVRGGHLTNDGCTKSIFPLPLTTAAGTFFRSGTLSKSEHISRGVSLVR